MPDIRTILCPVDFSPASDHALSYAVGLAKKLKADIHIVHVWQPILYALGDGIVIPDSEVIKQMLADINARLDGLVGQYQKSGVKVSRAILEGVPYVEIVKIAEHHPVDLIVMGTHGRTGFSHLLLGSITERVARTSPIPVMTVRPET